MMGTLQDLAGTLMPCYLPGTVPPNAPVPWSILYLDPGTPESRPLAMATKARSYTHRLIVVQNTAGGCALLARRMVGLLDAAWTDEGLCTVAATSTPIEDSPDPSRPRWSSTLELDMHTSR